jgi:hypothetical protein
LTGLGPVLVSDDISVDNPGWACIKTTDIVGGKLAFYASKLLEKIPPL